MNKICRSIILLCVFMLAIVSVPSALAYFYTYAQTEGEVMAVLSDHSDIEETIVSGGKEIKITAEEGSDPVFVRVKYFAPHDESIVKTSVVPGEGWVKGETDSFGNTFYYYTKPIDGKDDDPDAIASITDTSLDISISRQQEEGQDSDFNVVVIHEMTPALFSLSEPDAEYKMYDETKGGWWYADWAYTVAPTTEVDG